MKKPAKPWNEFLTEDEIREAKYIYENNLQLSKELDAKFSKNGWLFLNKADLEQFTKVCNEPVDPERVKKIKKAFEKAEKRRKEFLKRDY